jgi:hypothetical protein
MRTKHHTLIVVTALFISLVAWFSYTKNKKEASQVSLSTVASFSDCVQAGFPISESDPRQCRTSDGKIFAEEKIEKITYMQATEDLITVELPFPGAVTGKTFTVIGKARGTWYFEASFPIEVLNASGTVIARGVAQAQSDWMTTEFVPFKAEIVAPMSYIGKATLVLKKDNPSGIKEKDASISFPITIEY